jgi:trehalose 6-phosphate synthase/phosphatase
VPAATSCLVLTAPFPTSELFRILSARLPLLRGLLGADLLVLQAADYARHLLST